MTYVPPSSHSIVFQAACSEAIDASMRPIRHRVIYRLARRFHVHDADKYNPKVASELNELFAATWGQARDEMASPPSIPVSERLVESRFVELIARDPQWRTLVLEEVVQERRWSDLWSRGYEFFFDRLRSLFEKLVSPHHPAARRTTGALTSFAAVLLAIWAPTKIPGNSRFYENTLQPLLKPFQSKYEIPVELTPKAQGDAVFHLKVIADDKDLIASIKPIVKPDQLSMTLHPTLSAPLRITPQIQYPSEGLGNPAAPATKPQGLPVHLIPAIDLPLLPKGLWDPNSGLTVSVTELDSPAKPQSTSEGASISDRPATPKGAFLKESLAPDMPGRPLDKIEADLGALNKSLETLGGDFQASKTDPQSNLATLQQSQNSIHSIATNQGRTMVINASPNSVHSVMLQWFGEDKKPAFCAMSFDVGNVSKENVDLSFTKEVCSSNTSLVDQLPRKLVLGPSAPQQLGPWMLSVDETRRHRLFQHAAILRFTWQAASPSKTLSTQVTQKLP